MQAAVWMHTDNVTYRQMNERFPVTTQDWAEGQSAFQECRNAGVAEPGAVP